MERRHYSDFFRVPDDYKANMTREAINETPDTWLDFYPHTKYVDFLNTLIATINGGTKSIWLTGNYGTGKSNAALVLQKLFMDDGERVKHWFADCKGKIYDSESLFNNLFARRSEGTLVVYDYNASGVGANDDFLVRLERGIVSALHEYSMSIPAKASLDAVVNRLHQEGDLFFIARDEIQGELAYLTPNIKTVEQLITELLKPHLSTDTPTDLLGDTQKVLHRRSIYLDVSVPTFKKWVGEILSANSLKRIVYIFDEFHPFIEANRESLKTFEEVSENPSISHFYFVPVTHMQMEAYLGESSTNARKANDRFHFRNLQMPNDTAFKLAAHAMKPIGDKKIEAEWKDEKDRLWQSVRGIAEVHFNAPSTDAGYVSNQSFYDILPIHPVAAFLLKFLSESARSNQRSIFEYLKGSADGREFQDFIRDGGPEIESKQFLTVDYLWKYFMEREDLGQSKEITTIRAEFERIKNRDFANKDEDDVDLRVLKAVLLFCLLSRLNPDGHERLKPTVENIKIAFQGDGAIVNVDSNIKSLAEKHCFSVTGGNIELFASSVPNDDLNKRKIDLEGKFHDLLSDKTTELLKTHKKSDLAKFSAGRFDLRVSDAPHTTLTNIQTTTRNRYDNGHNNDTGTVCLWFVVAKNRDEQLQIPEKIKSILNQLKDHRMIFFTFPNLTFCDSDVNLWDDYITQLAMYALDNKLTQSKISYERLEKEWFKRIRDVNTLIKVYTVMNGQIIITDTSWSKFKDIIGDYIRRTLLYCVDYLTEQTTAFGTNGLKAWAIAGIQYDNATGQYKQLVEMFKKQGIVADASWFNANPTHPIAQMRTLFDKKISNSIGKGGNLSIRKVYIELQRAPYGMKYNALSAFVLGVVLRYILDKGFQWDNLQKTGVLDMDTLAEIIEMVVKDDGSDKGIKGEKLVCRLSREEKIFIEKAPKMFGISNSVTDARVEDVLLQIQTKVEQISERVPLWVLSECINSETEPLAEIIKKVLEHICLAGSTSSKSSKTDERTNAIKEVGRLIQENNDLVEAVAKYVNGENFVNAFYMYVDRNAPTLVSLAQEIGDVSHAYCDAIKSKAAETSALLWKETDISDEINETEQEYTVIKLLKPIMGLTSYNPYKTVFAILTNAVKTINKLPKNLIVTAIPALSGLLSAIANNGAVSDIKEGLELNANSVKSLFFDISKTKSLEILKQNLQGMSISNDALLNIYNSLPNGFLHDESIFLENVRVKIDNDTKESTAKNIKEQWQRLTGTETPDAWALINGIPAMYAINVDDIIEIMRAVTTPESFSSDKLTELLTLMTALSPSFIEDCKNRFKSKTISHRFSKFNIDLSSLLDYLKSNYGSQPNKWPAKLDVYDFIRSRYQGTFAPQIAEKIKKTSAEELKSRLLQLAKDNPDLGLLFWE